MNDVPHSRPWIDESDLKAVRDVLKGGMIAEGRQVEAFERSVAETAECAGAVATGSGTAGLVLALEALSMPAGSEVILPTYACPAVLDAVLAVGAIPVLCDVGPCWNMTVETAARKLSPRTGAVIVVSTFGIRNPPGPYRDLNVPIIEDRCQEFRPPGCESAGRSELRRAQESPGSVAEGEMGDVQVYSFHGTKCLTTGEGGMAVSGRTELAEAMRAIRDGHGEAVPPSRCRGARMSDLQAALGLSQLARYEEFLARRRRIADHYFEALEGLAFELPRDVLSTSMFFRFPLRWRADFDHLRAQFGERKIQVRKGVDTLLHRTCGLEQDEFPEAEKLFAETVSLPIYPALDDQDRDRVVEACHELVRGG